MVTRYAIKPGILVIFVTLVMILSTSPNKSAAQTPAPSNAIYSWKLREVPGPTPWGAIASSSDGTRLVAADSGVRFGSPNGGYIYTSTDSGVTWTQRTNAGQRTWTAAASSSDGTKFVAAVDGGYIYTSTDSGATWTQRTSAGSRNWTNVSSSSDGTKLFAVAWAYEYEWDYFTTIANSIYTSIDSGASWTQRSGYGNSSVVASSSDGTKLVAADFGGYMQIGTYCGYIYTSTDSGATWTQRTSAGCGNWTHVASSSDGTKLVATTGCPYEECSDSYTYTSTDSGATWRQQTSTGTLHWSAIASSADGTQLIATDSVDRPPSAGYIYTSTDSGATWTQQTSAGCRIWWRVDWSTDGTKLLAADVDDVNYDGGYLYTSSDSGATWVQLTNPSDRPWQSIASSFDATKLVAVDSDGYIYISADSGATWTQNSSLGNVSWLEIVSSYDGTKLAAITEGDGGGYIFTSRDSGSTWTLQTNAGLRAWQSVASSSDGAKLVAVDYGGGSGGYIYTSSDYGATWTPQTNGGSRSWTTVASSCDGTRLVAGDTGCSDGSCSGGYIYTSTDSGATWVRRRNAGSRSWQAVASSSDGTKLVAFEQSGYLYTSASSGATWIRRANAGKRSWSAVGSSSDGTRLIAAEAGGYIYISADSGVTWTPQTGAFIQHWQSLASSSDGSKIIAASGSIWTGSPATQPVIDNPASITVTTSTAALGATIESSGGSPITAAGIAYGASADPGISGSRKSTTTTSGAFTVDVAGLTPNTLYHFRGYATNLEGTSYTDDAQFTTISGAPRARAASDIAAAGFTANWAVPPGTATIMYYQLDVGTDARFSSFVTGFNNLSVTGASAEVTGLTSGKTYYYRVRAVNDGGTSADSNPVRAVFSPSNTLSNQTGGSSSGFSSYSLSGLEGTCVNVSAASRNRSAMKVSAGPDQNVCELARVELSGSNSTNIVKADASYLWTQLDGPRVTLSSPNAVETGLIAPEGGVDGESLRFQLSVTETYGAQSTDDCIINVVKDVAPPTANAGSNRTVTGYQIAVLDGSGSSAFDAGILSYSWRQVSGVPVSLSDPSAAQPTFVAPSAGEAIVFELTVTDQAGLRSRDSCIVNVVTGNLPPIAKAGPNQMVQPGSTVILDGSGSTDEDNGIVSYAWRQITGSPVTLSDPSAIQPSFAAPLTDADTEDLVFELTVTDSGGLQGNAGVVITVASGAAAR